MSFFTEQSMMEDTSIPEDAHEQAKLRATYASFGDGGVTATANAYGHLLQITRYAENVPSCFVCVDLEETPPPSSISERMATLQSNIERDDRGMRLITEGYSGHNALEVEKSKPKMKFHHDRWPCFITATTDFDLTIKYFINNDTVYQIYTYTLKSTSTRTPFFPKMTINHKVLIRDLVFLEEIGPLETMNSPQDNSPQETNDEYIVRRQKLNQNREPTVGLSIRSFINDSPQPLRGCRINPANKMKDYLKEDGTIKITLAYTLEVNPRNNDNNINPSLPHQSTGTLQQIMDIPNAPFSIPSFTTEKHLNFTLRRNLEHILSVCSIPIDNPLNEVPHIALTCGDISGHRITTAASFYAFQFLLKALKHFHTIRKCRECTFQKSSCMDYDCRMRSRIWRVCFGHIKWVCGKMQGKEEGFIPPHHWANGEVIAEWNKHSVLRGKSLTDTPFQIIKVADFCQEFGKSIRETVTEGFDLLIENWIEKLDERNKSGKYAFPHFREEPTHLFYFSDHVLIWRALKSVESLGLASELKASSSKSYSSVKIQNNIISRFTTTEDSLVKRRMLAVSRSPSENGFLFQPEDTVLFYAMDMGLFDKPGMAINESNIWINKIDVWRSIVDCQVQHEDNQDVHWVDPLQFALSLILSAGNKGVNSRPATEMHTYSKWILFGSSSMNGLFPGHLDENKEPIGFSDESRSEQYWYTTFEVPYILWRYVIPPSQEERKKHEQQKLQTDSLQPTMTADQVVALTLPKIHQMLEDILEHKDVASSKEDVFLRRSMPFNNIIDQKNIANPTDEWLFNEPQFFNHVGDISEKIKKFLNGGNSDENGINIRADDIMRHIMVYTTNEAQNPQAQSPEVQIGYIVDVPKTKHHQKGKVDPINISHNKEIYSHVSKQRTREDAKKRLFLFSRANPVTALACYLASPDSDKEELSFFFRRHATYDKYFNEEITPVLNKWVTELHLSFYQIVTRNKLPIVSSIPPLDQNELLSINSPDKKNWISRVVMSFRFDGDFFDRYWTCHFFEFDPKGIEGNKEPPRDILTANGASKMNHWKQRQVLELALVEYMLKEMLEGANNIIHEVKNGILRRSMKPESVPVVNLITVFSDPLHLFADVSSKSVVDFTRQTWRQFQHLLQGVEDDLGDNLVKIGLWRNREKERGLNRPRWTLNDERHYRGTISALIASINQKIRELEQCHADIASLKASLIKRLEIAQEEWENRNTNDIRLFTYVTVVFLPIGFATGVFSMSSAPTKETLSSMVITAGLALLVTVMALLNASVLEAETFKPLFHIFRPTPDTVLRPVLGILGYIFRILGYILRLVYLLVYLIFRMAYLLVYLILLSLLLFLPGKYIDSLYLLDVYMFDPMNASAQKALSELANFQQSKTEKSLSYEINNKKKQLSIESWKRELATWGGNRTEEGCIEGSSDETIAASNGEVSGNSTFKMMERIRDFFGVGIRESERISV